MCSDFFFLFFFQIKVDKEVFLKNLENQEFFILLVENLIHEFETKKLSMETLGEYLGAIRAELGLTLEEVSQKTGIYEKFIHYMETGKYNLLPPSVYILGFIKKLSTVYKISPDPLIAQYRKENGVTGASVHRDAADPNTLVVTHQFGSLSQAQAFANSEDLKSTMEKAGVSGPPEIWFTEDVESTPY